MLEMFFDNEKVFSVFEEILKNGSEEVNVFNICFNLGISPKLSSEIIKDFVFLGILNETDKIDQGIFEFNPESPIVMGICLFDDFIGKFVLNKLFNKGDDEVGNIFEDEGIFEFLKENGFKL